MKRLAKKKSGSGAFRIFLMFKWVQCDMCKEEFRREWGWSFETGPCHGRNGGVWRKLCCVCAPTITDVLKGDFFQL